MNWTISWGSGEQSFADLGLSNLRRRRINQGRDVLTFRHGTLGTMANQPLIEPFATVTVSRDGAIWFTGTAVAMGASGTARAEDHEYGIYGPWWHLESIVYQQPWNIAIDPDDQDSQLAATMKSHIILGQNQNGEQLTMRQQLLQILNYAVACGAPLAFEIGEESLAGTFPLDECRDLSCAEAIQRVLRWAPSVRTAFDYGQEIPVLRFTERSSAQYFTVPMDGKMQSLSMTPRYDLQLRAVAIKYERTHRSGSRVWRTVSVDRYPANVSENQSRVLVLTVELEGSRSQYLRQDINAATVDINSVQWWKRHLPALEDVENLQILSPSRQSELPRELVSGCISDWMGVDCESDIARATVAYGSGDSEVSGQEVAVRFLATDAQTRTYAALSNFVAEEVAPVGIAQSFFSSLSQCPFEGTLRLVGGEIASVPMGSLLRISGGQTTWEAMDADLQECSEDVDSGIVDLRFGPPSHLGLGQLIQLARANRGREAPSGAIIRLSGEGSADKISQPSHTATENSHSGGTTYGKLSIAAAGDGGGQIILDANDLATSNLVLKPREEYVVENGELRLRMSLASQPYAIGGEE
ncbi:MAG: hypothetical protein LBB38_03470 [Puniceicoccales bacterium]|nr:hypothetical protein [Puniceicoccales bacterium]